MHLCIMMVPCSVLMKKSTLRISIATGHCTTPLKSSDDDVFQSPVKSPGAVVRSPAAKRLCKKVIRKNYYYVNILSETNQNNEKYSKIKKLVSLKI